MGKYSRRTYVKMAGLGAIGFSGIISPTRGQPTGEWRTADSPTTKTLFGASSTSQGPYTVGAGGDVLTRGIEGWTKVVEYGPQARSRPLTGCDTTDDGKSLWFVGGSGVIGEYNVETRTLTNYSAPKGKTSTWEDCAVVGTIGDERLYFVNGSGELLIGTRDSSGAIRYQDVTKPGGGSTIPGIDFNSRKEGHVCSTSQLVSQTTDGGGSWTKIGIDFAGQNFFDIASVGTNDVNVAGGGGIVYRYDGFRWTPHVIDDGRQAIHGIDRDGTSGLAAGNKGKVYERLSAGEWRSFQTPVSVELRSVARGKTYDVAVGAGGTIIERTVGRSEDTSDQTGDNTSSRKNGTRTSDGSTSMETVRTLPESLDQSKTEVSINRKEVESYIEGNWIDKRKE